MESAEYDESLDEITVSAGTVPPVGTEEFSLVVC